MTEPEYKRLHARIVKRLNKAHIPMVAEATGLNDRGLRLIASKVTQRPRTATLERLEEYFNR